MRKEYQASKNLGKFFQNLLEIKEFIKNKSSKNEDPILKEIYDKLDKVIKQKK
ncbi:hypothetical protein [Parachlamydia acanthamoebae]|uniref:hypothetical protein n=1 Tax=Parachlamydia acanthamoebae TaxID=83552 RepID=UPI000ABC8A6B|nr:hypothetical protein [Parachlamydia acanthamoebae]